MSNSTRFNTLRLTSSRTDVADESFEVDGDDCPDLREQALVACVVAIVALSGCSERDPDAPFSIGEPNVLEVRLGGSPGELVGADWPRLDDGRWLSMTEHRDLPRLVVHYDDRSFALPVERVFIEQVNERVQDVTIHPLFRPLPFLDALRCCEELFVRNGVTVLPEFLPEIEQWKREVPTVEATMHTDGTRTYPTITRGLRTVLPGGQSMHVEIRNYLGEGWIVVLDVFRSSE